MQIMAAQTGVEVYRVRDLHALPLLLEELSGRRLIVIDTAGSSPLRQAQELAELDPNIALHAVMPAEASSDQFRRLHSAPNPPWKSLMLSKADDQPNPWPLFGFLTAHPLPVSALCHSERAQDGLASHGLGELVRWAVDKLQHSLDQNAAAGTPLPALLPRPVPKTPARKTKPRASRATKSTPAATSSAAPLTCLQ
jgi:flagellar biosynthesis GTPase FlhF